GDPVNADDPLVSLESDKATMEVPAPQGGTIEKLLIKIGDKVSEGTPIMLLRGGDGALTQPPSLVEQQEPAPAQQTSPVSRPPAQATAPAPAPSAAPAAGGPAQGAAQTAASFGQAHASPSVRRLARELGVDLNQIKGTGEKGRITRDDVKSFLRGPAAAPAASAAPAGGMGIPEIPAQDFSKFGPVETKPLPRIKKIS